MIPKFTELFGLNIDAVEFVTFDHLLAFLAKFLLQFVIIVNFIRLFLAKASAAK